MLLGNEKIANKNVFYVKFSFEKPITAQYYILKLN